VEAVPQTNFNNENMKQHPAQKPIEVMRWLVNATTTTGDLIVDPFCGSGTTGIAATQLKRRFYGIETNKEYLNMAEGRLALYGHRE
jgi:site-specific DNA-methyltransferase (adenine-specific)